MIFLRSLLFMVGVVPLTIVISLLLNLARPLPFRVRYRIGVAWRKGFLWLSRYVLGIRVKVKGLENVPKEPCIVLAKHQSAWETVGLQEYFPPVVFVLKRELLSVPFFGWGLATLKMISINRRAGRDSLMQVVEQGRERLKQGIGVIIFPEGTRVAAGKKGRYKIGGAHLAIHAGAKVVPVAHNAGELWPRQAFLKRPGTITVSIGPVIDPTGMTETALNAQVEAWIEGEMAQISRVHRKSHGRAAEPAQGA